MPVDNLVLFQMASDEKFYLALPVGFEDWAVQCQAAYKEVVAWTLKTKTKGCLGCGSVTKIMTPLMNALGRRLALAKQHNSGDVEPLAQYIAVRRGFRPRPIMLYYRAENGKISILKL